MSASSSPQTPATEPSLSASLEQHSTPVVFQISPLIRITLLSLYGGLTVPLPFLAQVTDAPVPPWGLTIGLTIGAIALYAVLTERVIVTDDQIQVTYPGWVAVVLRKGWTLPWTDIQALKPRSTGQGGIVYYFLTRSGEARLLPMRIAGFAQLVRLVQAKTAIDTTDVRPLSQPWMYLILLVVTVLLWLIDGWTILTATSL